jgi:hypothetical protein
LVEVDEDTDIEVGGDTGTGPDAGGAAKSRCKTRSAVAKQSVSAAAAAVSAVKAVEKMKKRKRKVNSPLAVVTPSIPTPRSREVESKEEEEDEAVEELPVEAARPARRPESPAAKRQRDWWRSRWRKPSVVVWRRSELLPQRRASCLCRLGLDSLGRSRVFWPSRGKKVLST